jgi:hypothetical protein
MAVHRFTVNVPNQTPRAAAPELRLEPVSGRDLRRLGLRFPKGKLRVERSGIAREPCAEGEQTLKLRLRALESVDVYVTAVTDPADPAVGGAVAFNLTDWRDGRVAGGVLLACVDPPLADPAGQVIPTARPCPVTLARDLYTVAVGADPSKPGRRTLPLGATVDLVAPLTNPRSRRLTEVTAYLEHLGGSDATFVPTAWNIGALGRGDVFFATWTVSADGFLVGSFDVSVVVQSAGTDLTRLRAPIRVAPERDERRGARPRRTSRAPGRGRTGQV